MTGILTSQPVGQLGGGSFPFGMWDASGVGAGPYYNVHVIFDPAGNAAITPALDSSIQSVITLLGKPLTVTFGAGASLAVSQLPPTAATTAGQAAMVSAIGQLQTVLTGTLQIGAQAGLPLPSGASTSANQVLSQSLVNQILSAVQGALTINTPAGVALDSSLQSILSVLQATVELATSLWTDNASPTPHFYIRRELVNETTQAVTVTFENPDGTTASVASSSLTPVTADSALQAVEAYFDVTTAGTGFAVGDVLLRLLILNKAASPPVSSSPMWLNLTQGTTLSASPPASSIVEQTKNIAVTASLPAGANKIGVVTTDQTSHGTSDKVAADLFQGGAAVGAANPVSVSDSNNAGYATSAPLTAGTGTTAARAVGVACTAPGSIVLTLKGVGTVTLPISPGWQVLPFQATMFTFANGAAGSVYNLS